MKTLTKRLILISVIAAVALSGCENAGTSAIDTASQQQNYSNSQQQQPVSSQQSTPQSHQNTMSSSQQSTSQDHQNTSSSSQQSSKNASSTQGQPSSSGSLSVTGSVSNESDSISDESWALILVNADSPLPDGYSVSLVELRNFQYVDERIYPDLQQMFDDMRADGMLPLIISSYRSPEEQQQIIDDKIEGYVEQGYSAKEAEQLAYFEAAKVGCSEHESGLAIDINAEDGDLWEIYNWLAQNAWQYGFILRYPDGKEQITGITYEPWHYRYVGKTAAKEIYDNNLTLEEYLGQ